MNEVNNKFEIVNEAHPHRKSSVPTDPTQTAGFAWIKSGYQPDPEL